MSIGDALETPGVVVSGELLGRQVRFFVADAKDEIQKHHAAGRFYEPQELALIARFFPRGGVFLDVGANVGNHILYAHTAALTDRFIAIEPNPRAIEILTKNLALNDVRCDLRFLGVGLSDHAARANVHTRFANNLGDTRLVPSPEGAVDLVRGDDLLKGEAVDFIKIDVEGGEIAVLDGLEETIARNRPPIFIEVDDRNHWFFDNWLYTHSYIVIAGHRRYSANKNYMIQANERPHLAAPIIEGFDD